MKKIFLVVMVVLLFCQVAVLAGDKTFFIKGVTITRNNSPLTTNQIVFTKNAQALTLFEPGGAPLDPEFKIDNGAVFDNGSGLGRNVQISTVVNDSIAARVWTPAVGADNYYADRTLSMTSANYDNSSLTWSWDNLKVDYKAAPPYKPTITQFIESVNTQAADGSKSSSLVVASQAGTGSDGLREISSRSWKMWLSGEAEPASPLTGKTEPSLTIGEESLSIGKSYSFRVAYNNEWGESEWSDVETYQVSGGGEGGAQEAILTFESGVANNKFGINFFSMPFPPDKDGKWYAFTKTGEPLAANQISNAYDLVRVVNAAAGGERVSTFGYWDSAAVEQKAIGQIIAYDNNGLLQPAHETALKNTPLSSERGYQLYLTAGNKVELLIRNYE